MTFEEWWETFSRDSVDGDVDLLVRAAWEAAWDKQQRVIDEMHLMFRDKVLVPVEPTEEMIEEACRTDFNFYDKNIRRAWKVMLQMAQEE